MLTVSLAEIFKECTSKFENTGAVSITVRVAKLHTVSYILYGV